jgi:hypothetical protein
MKIDPIAFVIKCIDEKMLDNVFTDEVFDFSLQAFVFSALGFSISKDFYDDIVENPDHYRKMIEGPEIVSGSKAYNRNPKPKDEGAVYTVENPNVTCARVKDWKGRIYYIPVNELGKI